jgi:hypothetical protein
MRGVKRIMLLVDFVMTIRIVDIFDRVLQCSLVSYIPLPVISTTDRRLCLQPITWCTVSIWSRAHWDL